MNFCGNDCKSDPIATIPEAHIGSARKIRFNDGKVDFQGRLWAGSMAMDPLANPDAGRFYCLQRATGTDDGYDLVEKICPVGISNGMDWYGEHMYYIDSFEPV